MLGRHYSYDSSSLPIGIMVSVLGFHFTAARRSPRRQNRVESKQEESKTIAVRLHGGVAGPETGQGEAVVGVGLDARTLIEASRDCRPTAAV